MEALARGLHVKDAQLQPTLDAIAHSAVNTLPSARHGGLILLERGKLVPQATTGQPPHLLDLLQQRLGDGPCADTAARQSMNKIDDTGAEIRWPAFNAEASRLGVRSLLCLPVWVHDHRLGALTLYGDQPAAFDEAAVAVARLFATLAALALADALRTEQLKQALANRDLIGQAKGILMERHLLTSDAAFERLARSSQSTNRKLTVIAECLVETGELPG